MIPAAGWPVSPVFGSNPSSWPLTSSIGLSMESVPGENVAEWKTHVSLYGSTVEG